jgi:peptide methionine sulfoxide reductase MsrA
MKKSRIISIYNFLSNIKLNKVTNKEVRSAIISNHLQMYNINEQYNKDVQELQKRIFEGKEEDINVVNNLRNKFKNAKEEDRPSIVSEILEHKEFLKLEEEFNTEVYNLLNQEIDLNFKTCSQEDFVETCVEANVDITSDDLIVLTDLFNK